MIYFNHTTPFLFSSDVDSKTIRRPFEDHSKTIRGTFAGRKERTEGIPKTALCTKESRLGGPKKGVQVSHYFPFVLAVGAVGGDDSGSVGYKMTFLGLCGGLPRDMAAPIHYPPSQRLGPIAQSLCGQLGRTCP